MTRVAEILRFKGSMIHTVSTEASVFEAVATMVRHKIGSLLVMDADQVAGIFTERDYLTRVTLEERDAKSTPVREVMTSRLVCVDPDKTVSECMAMMTRERIRHLPVIADGGLVGMISIGDLVKHVSNEQAVEIRYLTEYITGRPES